MTTEATTQIESPRAEISKAIAGRTKVAPAKTRSAKVAASAKPAKVAAPAKGIAIPAKFAGKKIFKTALGENARRGETRRTASWNALKNGVSYDAALKAGVVAADLAKILVLKHAELR